MTLLLHTSPVAEGQLFSYKVYIVQTPIGAGTCYVEENAPSLSRDLIGRDLRNASLETPLWVAYCDALTQGIEPSNQEFSTLQGDTAQKALQRALLISRAIKTLSVRSDRPIRSVALIGAVETIILTLHADGISVSTADMSENLIGKDMGGVVVQSATATLPLVTQADCAVVTGMTLGNDTFWDILDAANSSETLLIMYCETAPHLASFLLEAGVDCVLSEFFPFYIFHGPSICALSYKT